MGAEYHGWWGMGGFPFMPFLFFLFIAVCVFIMLRGGMMCRMGGTHGQGDAQLQSDPLETPLDILKKRYAGGEINKEEFEKIKKDIE